MSDATHDLAEIGRRIERLTLAPDSISAPFHRFLRPVLFRIGWRPRTRVKRIRALMAAVDGFHSDASTRDACAGALKAALRELDDNLRQAERATVINQRILLPYAAWLRRCYELTVVAHRAITDLKMLPAAVADSNDAGAHADALVVGLRDDSLLEPPLAMGRSRGRRGPIDEEQDARDEPVADAARVLGLQLDTVDHLMAAAREDDALLGRRRRLLHSARQLLLETSAALDLDKAGVQSRLQNIGRQITLINRYEAMGLRTDVDLLHQARTAVARGEAEKLFAAVSVIRRRAADTGDKEVTVLADGMIRELIGAHGSPDGEASLLRSGQELFGARVVEAVAEGYRRARDQENLVPDTFEGALIKQYFAPGRDHDTLAHALAVDGCFEVGGTLSPIRIEEDFLVSRVVPFPTQQLQVVTASGPGDIASSVISDPRTVIMDLAAGRLLARRFVQEEASKRTKTVMQGEVRVYLLDGSSSMIGPRARMRDAILVAELATLVERLENPRKSTRVTLFYRYFTEVMGPVFRVDTPGRAIEAIRDVVASARLGGTDIQGALLSSMQLIGDAARDDPDLARAQIVLVTDGEAAVSQAKVSRARHEIRDMPLGISVIALGEENDALRDIVAQQRARGERAFYHFIPDDHLERLSERNTDDSAMVHLPAVPHRSVGAGPLSDEIGPLLERLADLKRSRADEALRDLDRVDRDYRVDPGALSTAGEGERSRLEALYRDDVALARRYARWFPPPRAPGSGPGPVALPQAGTLERDDLDSVLVVLATISEVVETVRSDRLGRQADAIDLLERLLPDAPLSPARYHEVLRLFPDALAPALAAVHSAAQSGLGWRLEGFG